MAMMEQSRIDHYPSAGALRQVAASRELEPRKRKGGRTRDLEAESKGECASVEIETENESGSESGVGSRSGGDERRENGHREWHGGPNRDMQVGAPSGKREEVSVWLRALGGHGLGSRKGSGEKVNT